jgi:hypothetical protein
MIKSVPHDLDYKNAKSFHSINNYLLYISFLMSIIIIFIDNHIIKVLTPEKLISTLNSILSIIAILYFVFDIVQNYIFQRAEQHRRADFVDNSLGTTLADKNSTGYYSNESIYKGLYKMGINCFEDSFFSMKISSKMINIELIKSFFITLAFLSLAFFTNLKLLNAIIQLTLPFVILQRTIRLILFNIRIKELYNDFKIAFELKPSERDQHLLYFVLRYETIISWGSILLSTKIFNKLNKELTAEWSKIKIRYEIT